jgi:hypothetical protein
MMKQIMLMKNRMLGERKEKEATQLDKEDAVSDSRRRRKRRLFGRRGTDEVADDAEETNEAE